MLSVYAVPQNKWNQRHKKIKNGASGTNAICGCIIKTKARRLAGLYLTLLCGYHASVARETPLLISNAHSRASQEPGRVVFDFTLWLPCKRGTRNPTPHFQCTFSRQSGECANTAQKPIALSG
jgi:hypothetical protein